MKEEIMIWVKWEKDGIEADPWIIKANKDEKVTWVSQGIPFAILFKDSSPVDFFSESSTEDTSGEHKITGTIVWDHTQLGGKSFIYNIAAVKDSEVRIVDPEIIVPRGPGAAGGRD